METKETRGVIHAWMYFFPKSNICFAIQEISDRSYGGLIFMNPDFLKKDKLKNISGQYICTGSSKSDVYDKIIASIKDNHELDFSNIQCKQKF